MGIKFSQSDGVSGVGAFPERRRGSAFLSFHHGAGEGGERSLGPFSPLEWGGNRFPTGRDDGLGGWKIEERVGGGNRRYFGKFPARGRRIDKGSKIYWAFAKFPTWLVIHFFSDKKLGVVK